MQIFVKTLTGKTITLDLRGGMQIFFKTLWCSRNPQDGRLCTQRSSRTLTRKTTPHGLRGGMQIFVKTLTSKIITLHLRGGMQIFVKTLQSKTNSQRGRGGMQML